jgi:SAM-dependent methyltransferase
MDIDLINENTQAIVDAGLRVLQIHRFADSDVDHVKYLLNFAKFEKDSYVIDMGSGIGEVARIMKETRPDLDFDLVNISSEQLRFSPRNMPKILANFLEIPMPDETYDAVMFCFSIGHEDHEKSIGEARRILRTGGVLFIYDMVRVSGSNESMRDVEYSVLPVEEFLDIVESNGFDLTDYERPDEVGKYGIDVLGVEYDRIFNGTEPALWRFIKC